MKRRKRELSLGEEGSLFWALTKRGPMGYCRTLVRRTQVGLDSRLIVLGSEPKSGWLVRCLRSIEPSCWTISVR